LLRSFFAFPDGTSRPTPVLRAVRISVASIHR
jgi:hypothetical protein